MVYNKVTQLYVYIYPLLFGFFFHLGLQAREQWVECPVLYSRFSLVIYYSIYGASLLAQLVKNLPAVQETWVWSQGREDSLEKEVGSHSSTLAWKIPWTEEPGGLQSMGSQRVRHDWMTNTFTFTLHSVFGLPQWFNGKESTCNAGDVGSIPGLERSSGGGHGNPLQYSCLENSMDRGTWQATVHGVTRSWTWLKWLSSSLYSIRMSIPVSFPPDLFPPWCPYICSLHLCLYFYFANRLISTIFLDSTYFDYVRNSAQTSSSQKVTFVVSGNRSVQRWLQAHLYPWAQVMYLALCLCHLFLLFWFLA